MSMARKGNFKFKYTKHAASYCLILFIKEISDMQKP